MRSDVLVGRATTSWMTQLRIVVLTGMPGVGKSTVAALLAARLPSAAHVKADVFHRMILSGREWPSSGTARAREQHLLRSRNAFAVAANFCAAGILPIVDDVLCLPAHAHILTSEPWPVLVFGLTADWPTVLNRDAGRGKHTASLYRDVERQIREVLGDAVTWIETSQHTAEEVVDHIFGHID
jgi:energy-coupling factor transporter ATP-binding protein EcfA2